MFYLENDYEENKYRVRGSLDRMKENIGKCLKDRRQGGGPLEAYMGSKCSPSLVFVVGVATRHCSLLTSTCLTSLLLAPVTSMSPTVLLSFPLFSLFLFPHFIFVFSFFRPASRMQEQGSTFLQPLAKTTLFRLYRIENNAVLFFFKYNSKRRRLWLPESKTASF